METKPLPSGLPDVSNGTEAWLHVEGDEDTTIRPADPEWMRQFKAEYPELFENLPKPPGSQEVISPDHRSVDIGRQTAETKICMKIKLIGAGQAVLSTGIGFFDHMLTLLAKHSLMDLNIEAKGDLHVDAHHTVEDVGICLGKALAQALGDKSGIRRYGSATIPMDEALVTAAVDLSGRAFCVWKADLPPEMLGTFNAPLAEEFWRAVSSSGAFNLHVVCHHGKNSHHIVEAIFKACARALRQAIEPDPRMPGVPSTKGVL
jgi:imidazoleglycerol-phosphate dehydratase